MSYSPVSTDSLTDSDTDFTVDSLTESRTVSVPDQCYYFAAIMVAAEQKAAEQHKKLLNDIIKFSLKKDKAKQNQLKDEKKSTADEKFWVEKNKLVLQQDKLKSYNFLYWLNCFSKQEISTGEFNKIDDAEIKQKIKQAQLKFDDPNGCYEGVVIDGFWNLFVIGVCAGVAAIAGPVSLAIFSVEALVDRSFSYLYGLVVSYILTECITKKYADENRKQLAAFPFDAQYKTGQTHQPAIEAHFQRRHLDQYLEATKARNNMRYKFIGWQVGVLMFSIIYEAFKVSLLSLGPAGWGLNFLAAAVSGACIAAIHYKVLERDYENDILFHIFEEMQSVSSDDDKKDARDVRLCAISKLNIEYPETRQGYCEVTKQAKFRKLLINEMRSNKSFMVELKNTRSRFELEGHPISQRFQKSWKRITFASFMNGFWFTFLPAPVYMLLSQGFGLAGGALIGANIAVSTVVISTSTAVTISTSAFFANKEKQALQEPQKHSEIQPLISL